MNLLDVWYLFSWMCFMNIFWNSFILVVVCFNIQLTPAVSSCPCVCHFADLALILGKSSVTVQQKPDDIPPGPIKILHSHRTLFVGCCSDPSLAVGISFGELVSWWLSPNNMLGDYKWLSALLNMASSHTHTHTHTHTILQIKDQKY